MSLNQAVARAMKFVVVAFVIEALVAKSVVAVAFTKLVFVAKKFVLVAPEKVPVPPVIATDEAFCRAIVPRPAIEEVEMAIAVLETEITRPRTSVVKTGTVEALP